MMYIITKRVDAKSFKDAIAREGRGEIIDVKKETPEGKAMGF